MSRDEGDDWETLDAPGSKRIGISARYLLKLTVCCLVGLILCLWIIGQGAIPSGLIAVSVPALALACVAAPIALARMQVRLTPGGMRLRLPLGRVVIRWPDVTVRLDDQPNYVTISAPRCERRGWSRSLRATGGAIRLKASWFGMSAETLHDMIATYQARVSRSSGRGEGPSP